MLVDRQGCLGYLVPANWEQGNDALPETKETSMSRKIWNEIAASKPETIFRNVIFKGVAGFAVDPENWKAE